MSKRIKGITIELDGETKGLDKALGDVNKKSRDLQGELRQVERALKFNPGNAELVAQKQQLLAKEVENTGEKLKRLKDAQADVDRQFAEGKINEEQYRAFQREIIETESKLKHFEGQLSTSQSKLKTFGDSAIEAGEKLKKVGEKTTEVGKSLTTKVTAPLAGVGAIAAKVGSDFEAGMSKVQAISGASASDISLLTDKAREMGATTQFSASEAADALSYMAMAGWKTNDMLSGIDGIMALAAASGEDLALTSDIVTDALTAFGMTAKDSGKFADVLAAASSNANTNVAMLGESFKYVAPLAGAMGYSAEDTSLALGLMANAGVKASQAGTTLKTMFANMAKPTKAIGNGMNDLGISLTDAEGNMKTMEEMLQNLRSSFSGLTEQQQAAYASQIFGKEAMAGALAVINASETDYNKLAEAIYNSEGAAQEMAKTMTDNLQGRLKEMQSALEEAAISIYNNLQPALESLVGFVQKLADWFNGLSPAAQNTVMALAGVAAAIGPILVIVGTLVTALGGVLTAFGTVSGAIAVVAGGATAATPAVGALAAVFTALTGPIGIAVAAIAALTVGGIALYNHLKKDAIPEVNRFGEGVTEATQEALGGFFELSDGASQALADMSISGLKVTDEMANEMVTKYNTMNKQIVDGLNQQHAERMESMQSFFLNSSVLTDEEEAAILQKQENSHNLQILSQESKNKRIKEIMQQAAKENRELTQSEADEISNINKSMNENAVKALSANEVEQKIIMERMKETAGDMSALQAAEVVKNSAKQRNGAVEEANKQYDETLAQIIRMRDETGDISAEQADKLIAEATKQRDQTVTLAENMHAEVVEEAQKQADEHIDKVDWETGEILSKWQVFKNKTKETFSNIANDIKDSWNETWSSTKEKVEKIRNDAVVGFANLVIGIKNKMLDVVKKVTDIWGDTQSFLTNIDLLQVGKDIIQGLINGIGSMADSVVEKVKSLAESIPNWIKKVLGIHSPSRVMMEIGKHTGEGLAIGVDSTRAANEKAVLGVAKVLSNAARKNAEEISKIGEEAEKKRTEIQNEYAKKRAELNLKTSQSSQSAMKTHKNKKGEIVRTGEQKVLKIRQDASSKLTKLNEEEQKKLTAINNKAWADMVKKEGELAKERLEAVKTYVADKKSMDELSLIAETEVWRKSLALFNEGTKERVEIQKGYQAALKAVNDEVTKTNEEYAGKMTVISDKLREEEKKLTDEYEKTLEDRTKALISFSNTFDFFEVKLDKSSEDLMANLKSQVFAFERWQQEIDAISKKAIDKGLIEELKAMGPKALPELIMLNSMTDKQLSEYSDLYSKKSRLAREQAEKELIGMKSDTEKRIKDLRTTANSELESLRSEWVLKIQSITKATDGELKSLKQIGVNAGQGLLDGLASMENSLVNTARSIANAVSAEMRKALQVKSPSRVMMEIGEFVGEGLVVGMENMLNDIKRVAARMGDFAVPTMPDVAMGGVSGGGRSVSGPTTSAGSGVIVQQEINIHSPKHLSPVESARKYKQAGIELGMAYNLGR